MNEEKGGLSACFDESNLIAYLSRQPDVSAAYLFGSHAQGRAHPRSDVDLAILIDEERLPPETTLFERRLHLMNVLADFVQKEVDVVTLNDAPPLLCHQVMLHGRLLYEGDQEQRIAFEVRTGKIYNDLKPMYEFFNRELLREIKEGRFGKRRRSRAGSAPTAPR
jgi:uncharacterized protein